MKDNLRFRQIHLDFHTSGDIKNIGENFEPEKFAKTLSEANVDSITCFARGHHGWLYYDSKKFPERVHPHLKNKNILKEQIEACHKEGIRAPIYITVQWDLYTAKEHPEWRVVNEDGKLEGTGPYEAGFYQSLCVNTKYKEFLKEQTREVLEEFEPVDGIFFDIVQYKDCSCETCKTEMKKKNLNPENKKERRKYNKEVIDNFKMEMTELVKSYNQDSTVFYNAGHIGSDIHQSEAAYSHFEIESLPSGTWGYDHFPLVARYVRTLGKDFLGHTGKFHTEWGDFHSFKNKEALEYECMRMLSLNSKCLIGDQLPPAGELEPHVYQNLVGPVYKNVKEKEPWCEEVKAVTEIGVLNPEEFKDERVPVSASGVLRILEEGAYQFDVLDSKSDFSSYKLLILPDVITVDDELNDKLEEYINQGGKLIASGFSGLNNSKNEFKLKSLGVELSQTDVDQTVVGKNYERNDYADYIMPKDNFAEILPRTEHVMYLKGLKIMNKENTEVLADTYQSYFDRSWEHFCSHRQTPSAGEKSYPAVVKNENSIYFSHLIFKQYALRAPKWCKELVFSAVEELLADKIVEHDGPSTLRVTLNEQKNRKRQVLHLLHYIPVRKSKEIDIIEDIIPLYDLNISLKTDKKIESIYEVPSKKEIDFKINNNRIEFKVSKLEGHSMIEINYIT